MMPHKTPRGQAALQRLSSFEGTPHPFDKTKRMVCPNALKNLRLKPNRKYCVLGELSHKVGWKHRDLVARLEEKRNVKGKATYLKRKAQKIQKDKATVEAVRPCPPIIRLPSSRLVSRKSIRCFTFSRLSLF